MNSNIIDIKISLWFRLLCLIFGLFCFFPLYLFITNSKKLSQDDIFWIILLVIFIILLFLAFWYFSSSYSYYPNDKLIVKRYFKKPVIYMISNLTGWSYSESEYSKSMELFINYNQKVDIVLFGKNITALVNKIIEDRFNSIKEKALKEIISNGVNHKTLFSKYYITKDYMEITRFNKTNKFIYQLCKNVQYVESSGHSFIKYIYQNKKYSIGSHAFRKNIGLFYGILEIFSKCT